MDIQYLPNFDDFVAKKVIKKYSSGRNRVFNNLMNNELFRLLGDNGPQVLQGLSIKRNNLSKIHIHNKIFNHVSFAGSSMMEVEIETCQFKVVHAQHCKFYNTHFLGDEKPFRIKNSDFSGSFFENCIFRNINFESNSLLDCVFWNCKFDNCKFRSTTFENTIFNVCQFDNVDMINLNIEFATIQCCRFKDSKFSWYQAPYINCFFDNIFEGENRFYTNACSYTLEEYKKQVDESIIYFTTKQQYFPLISLYLLQNNKEYALSALNNGIEQAKLERDIRTIGLYANAGLITGLYNTKNISLLLKELDVIISEQFNSTNDAYNRILYARIKQQLIAPEVLQKLEINIQTGYSEEDFSKAGELCREIDKIVEENKCKALYKFNHNSDIQIIVDIIAISVSVLAIILDTVKILLDHKKSTHNKEAVQNVNNYTFVLVNSTTNNSNTKDGN